MIEKDITIIIGRSGGSVTAIHAVHLGARVVLVEKDILGGICLNYSCMPPRH